MKSLLKIADIRYGRRLFFVLFLLFFSYLFVSRCVELNFIQDDAYTSLRYAKNFAEGKGLVFNEGEKVEGYTNFLWVLIIGDVALFDKMFGANIKLDTAAQVLSTFFGIVIIWLVYFLSRSINKKSSRNFLDELWDLAPPYLVSVSLPFIYWSSSGMETSLFISLSMLSFLLYIRMQNEQHFGISFIIVSFLNSLLRPEGMVFFALILLYSFLKYFRKSSAKNIYEKI